MAPDENQSLAAEYVLGVLPEAERRAFAARLAADHALQAEVASWEQHFASFNEAYAPVEPPAALRAKVQERLFGPEEKAGLWQSLAFWRGLGLAAVAALALVIALPRLAPQAPQSLAVAELSGEAKVVRLAVSFDPGSGLLRFNRYEGAAQAGRDFQLWAIIGKDAPVSLGVIPPDASGSIRLAPEIAAKITSSVLAISDEPKGGSPTGQPTGPVVSTGRLVPI